MCGVLPLGATRGGDVPHEQRVAGQRGAWGGRGGRSRRRQATGGDWGGRGGLGGGSPTGGRLTRDLLPPAIGHEQGVTLASIGCEGIHQLEFRQLEKLRTCDVRRDGGVGSPAARTLLVAPHEPSVAAAGDAAGRARRRLWSGGVRCSLHLLLQD